MLHKNVRLGLILLTLIVGGGVMAGAPLPLSGQALSAQAPAAQASADADTKPWRTLDRRPGTGEQCLVCRQPIHGEDVVEIRYQGRTFFVAAKMVDAFEGDPDTYFRALQARSAWFDERAHGGRRAPWGWLAFGCYVLIGLVFAAACGYLAIRRSLAPLPWFFAGLAGNVAALAVLLISPRGNPASVAATPHAPVLCPACGEANHPSARACGRCHAMLEPTVQSEMARTMVRAGEAS